MHKITVQRRDDNEYAVVVQPITELDKCSIISANAMEARGPREKIGAKTARFIDQTLKIEGVKLVATDTFMFHVVLDERTPWTKVGNDIVEAYCTHRQWDPREVKVVLPTRQPAEIGA